MTRSDKLNHAFEVFKTHKALYSKCGEGIEILHWTQLTTRHYALRYVFDLNGRAIYITGDLGEAVVCPTWRATFEDTVKAITSRHHCVNEQYFLEKVKTASYIYQNDRREYDRDDAIAEIKSRLPDIKEEDVEEIMLDYSTFKGFAFMSGRTVKILFAYDKKYISWIFDAGKSIDMRVYLWLVGLAMAWEQLHPQGENAKGVEA